jgi:hypothetical protein
MKPQLQAAETLANGIAYAPVTAQELLNNFRATFLRWKIACREQRRGRDWHFFDSVAAEP